MRKMRIWCLRTKTENLYRVQTLKNLQQQLDNSANFPDFITPCPQEALSLLIAGFSEDLWQVLLTLSVSEEVIWLHLAFVLCEETHLSQCSGKHNSTTTFQQCQWVGRPFFFIFPPLLYFLLPSVYFLNPRTADLASNKEKYTTDIVKHLYLLTALILPSEEWRSDVYV